jgi:hypothetical protein
MGFQIDLEGRMLHGSIAPCATQHDRELTQSLRFRDPAAADACALPRRAGFECRSPDPRTDGKKPEFQANFL